MSHRSVMLSCTLHPRYSPEKPQHLAYPAPGEPLCTQIRAGALQQGPRINPSWPWSCCTVGAWGWRDPAEQMRVKLHKQLLLALHPPTFPVTGSRSSFHGHQQLGVERCWSSFRGHQQLGEGRCWVPVHVVRGWAALCWGLLCAQGLDRSAHECRGCA